MVTFAKVVCWLVIIASFGCGIAYAISFFKNLEKYEGAEVLVKLGIAVFTFLAMLFKGIFGLHMLAPAVLSTGNLWLLLAIVAIPSETLFTAVFDLVFVICLGAEHPDKPTALTIITSVLLAFLLIFLFINKKMAKKEKQAAPQVVEEEKEEPTQK